MTFAPKTTLCHNNLKILRPKVMKILQTCIKKFCEFPHRLASIPLIYNIVIVFAGEYFQSHSLSWTQSRESDANWGRTVWIPEEK